MRRVVRSLLAAAVVASLAPFAAPGQTDEQLEIYIVDVEGGGATLFIAPSGESLLIDTGNGGDAAARDVGRIMLAIEDAGLDHLDHVVTTHYPGDHIGGIEVLAARIPITNFIDHGVPNVERPVPGGGERPGSDQRGSVYLPGYEQLYNQAQHTVVAAGDRIDVTGLDIQVVASHGEVIEDALPGAGTPNPYCEGYAPIAPDLSENGQSVGVSISFGRFRVAHLGDLTWNGELALMCPNNKLGTTDVFIVSHHAQQRPDAMSNSIPLVHALSPRIAISSNGIRKGAQVAAMEVLFTSPGLEDLWQLHFSQFSGQEYTVPGLFIANRYDGETSLPVAPMASQSPDPSAPPIPVHDGPAYFLKISAMRDGSFTVTNTRNGFSKTYAAP